MYPIIPAGRTSLDNINILDNNILDSINILDNINIWDNASLQLDPILKNKKRGTNKENGRITIFCAGFLSCEFVQYISVMSLLHKQSVGYVCVSSLQPTCSICEMQMQPLTPTKLNTARIQLLQERRIVRARIII